MLVNTLMEVLMLFDATRANECALVAIAAVTQQPVTVVQRCADAVNMLAQIRRYGTAPEETVRLLHLMGFGNAYIKHTSMERPPLATLIRWHRETHLDRVIYCTRSAPGSPIFHGVSIGPLGYVDLLEQEKGVKDPSDPRWKKSETPTLAPRRQVLWYISLG